MIQMEKIRKKPILNIKPFKKKNKNKFFYQNITIGLGGLKPLNGSIFDFSK
jgi:hypothetical protein